MSDREIQQTTPDSTIAQLCEAFASRWNSGTDSNSIEAFLRDADLNPLDHGNLITRLVQCEIELRRQQGLAVNREEYSRRFPGVSADVLENLFQLPAPPPLPFPSIQRPLLPPRYKVVEQIGRGGIGSVWRVEDRMMQRPLAAKVLLEKFRRNAAANARLEREALLAGSLQHPGIPPVFERGELVSGSSFFTMKLVEGQTLDDLLGKRGDAGENRQYFLGVFRQIAEAVGFAHSRGVIHRDLKPQNVMVGEFGEVQIMDWGMAKRLDELPGAGDKEMGALQTRPTIADDPEIPTTRRNVETNPMSLDSSLADARKVGALTLQGDVFGTPSYMPPEQARGDLDQFSERSDVFSLGAILFEILAKKRLYHEFDTESVVAAAAKCQTAVSLKYLESCGADDELVALCKTCLDGDPRKRPDNGLSVASAISDYLGGVEQRLKKAELETAASVARFAESRKRMRTTVSLVAVAAVIALAGLGGITWKWREANRNLLESEKQSAARDVYFSKSLAAVDQMLTRVGSEMLANVPQMSPIRRQLLNDALVFYNDLLQDSADDPALKREFGRIQKQVGVIHGKLGEQELAAAAFQRAAETFDELRKQEPEDILNLLNYCGARNSFAMSIHEIGKSADAEIVLREVIKLLDESQWRIEDVPPGQKERSGWLHLKADAHSFLASVLPTTRDNSSAMTELERALQYYQQIPGDQTSNDEQLSRALAMESLASHLERINQIPHSIDLRNQALTIINKLLEGTPESPDYRNCLANIQQSLNGIFARQGKSEEAVRGLEQEIEARRKLVGDFPNIPQLKQDYSRALALHGSVLNSIGNFERGQQSLTEAVEVAQKLVDQFPDTIDYQRELAYVCQSMGTACQKTGGEANLALSNTYYQKAYRTGQKILALAPRNARYEYEVGISARNWSAALLNLETDDRHARDLLVEAIGIFSRLSAEEPENTDYLYQLAYTRLNYTKLLSISDIAAAATVLEEACQAFSSLVDLQPGEPRYLLQLTRARDQLSTLQFQLGEVEAWEQSLRQANQIVEEVVAKFGRDPQLAQFLTISKNRLAHCLETRGKVDEAHQLFQETLAIRKEFLDNDPGNENIRRQLASSHANIAWNLAYWREPGQRNLDEALQHATTATQLDPGAAEHWTCRAHVRYRQGKYGDVEQILAGCEAVNEPDQMGRLALQAMNHWQLGDSAAAETALTDAKKLRDSEVVQNNFNSRLVEPEFYQLVEEADSLIEE